LDVDISLGEHVKIRSGGLLPLARSYSPVAIRSGEFDLIVKVYPRVFNYGTPAFVSDLLSSLRVGDHAQISGPYPPPLFQRMVRDTAKRVGVIALGVGITEAIGVIAGLPTTVHNIHLLWALRDHSEVYAKNMLEELVRTRAPALVIKYHFSKETGQRFDVETLLDVFPWRNGSAKDQRFLAVGTKKMMTSTYRMLEDAKIPFETLLTKKFGIRQSAESFGQRT